MKLSNPPNAIEDLKLVEELAFENWMKLAGPVKSAWKKYEAAKANHDHAVLYEKAKREVMRDLIKSAGVLNGGAL